MNSGYESNMPQMIPPESDALFDKIYAGMSKRKRDQIMNQCYADVNRFRSRFLPVASSVAQPQIHHHQHLHNSCCQEVMRLKEQLQKMTCSAIHLMKRLNEKNNQIEVIGKMNLSLRLKANSLFLENIALGQLAETNKVVITPMQTNMEEVLAHMDQHALPQEDSAGMESRHNSNADAEETKKMPKVRSYKDLISCKSCEKKESRVLLLPCRHLCLCDDCGGGSHQSIRVCLMCKAVVDFPMHVNMAFSADWMD